MNIFHENYNAESKGQELTEDIENFALLHTAYVKFKLLLQNVLKISLDLINARMLPIHAKILLQFKMKRIIIITFLKSGY